MAVFVQNRPVTTRDPVIAVDAGLTIGSHRFQLVVVDGAGRRSRPDTVVVRITAAAGGDVSPTQPIGPLSPRQRMRRQRSQR